MFQDSVPDGSYNDPFLSSVCVDMYMYVYIYILIERERERERERATAKRKHAIWHDLSRIVFFSIFRGVL